MRFLPFAALALLAMPAMAEVRFGVPEYEVREGDGQLVIPVLLTAQDSALNTVTVNFRTNAGTAMSPGDYTNVTGTLIWDPEDYEPKEITIPIVEDPSLEGSENFTVTLFDVTGTTLTAQPTSNITIFDNDGVGPGEFQFAVTDLLVFEDVGTATLTVRRLNGTDGPVSVEVTRVGGGTASPGVDFSDSAMVLTWPDGDDTTRQFSVGIIDDTAVEQTETILYTLQNPTGGSSITRGDATITIGDNDRDGTGSISFVQGNTRVIENQSVATLTVGRFDGSAGFATVDFITRSDTADNADFGAVAGTLTWGDGDLTTRTISVPIKDNLLVESDEQLFVDLTAGIGTTLGDIPSASVTIIDDDAASATSVISIAEANITVQDNAGTVTVNLQRTNPSGISSVQFATSDANANSGSDYVAVSRTITFADGQATASVSISILGPSGIDPEGPESFVATISAPNNATIVGSDTATITITPSSTGGGASVIDFIEQDGFSVSSCTGGASVPTVIIAANEQGGVLMFQRGPGTPVAASVAFRALTPCGATQPEDFTVTDGTLTWGSGDFSSRVIPISVVRDAVDADGQEEFLLELANPMGATIERELIRVVIEPGPGAGDPGPVGFTSTAIRLRDDAGPATVVLQRPSGSGRLVVGYQTVDGSAIAGVNYTAASGTVVWEATDFRNKAIVIPVFVSPTATPDLRFSLIATVTEGNALFTTSPQANITITSSVADQNQGVGGCSLGQADWFTHVFMLLLSVGFLNRRRFAGLLRGFHRGS